jgi:DNA-binding GntR family transcriptional regulator
MRGEGGGARTSYEDLIELRLLIELPALRRLADRGLADQELALIRELADATVRSARRGDVLDYLRADMTFHLCLLELLDDPVRSEIARLVLACGPSPAQEPELVMASEAREHRRLIELVVDDQGSAADDLLRLHLSRPRESRSA